MSFLASLFVGLCRRYLKTGDDVAMMAAEQLIDGMDLDEVWYSRSISPVNPEMEKLSRQLIKGKVARLDDFSGNPITCFVASKAEAKRLRKIRGLTEVLICLSTRTEKIAYLGTSCARICLLIALMALPLRVTSMSVHLSTSNSPIQPPTVHRQVRVEAAYPATRRLLRGANVDPQVLKGSLEDRGSSHCKSDVYQA